MSPKIQDKLEGDLFEQFQTADKRIKRKTRFLLPNIKHSITLSYEAVIFAAIAFLMCCIMFFSLGVEKGRFDMISSRNRIRAAEVKSDAGPVAETSAAAQAAKEPAHAPEPGAASEKKAYTIQLASFKKREYAESELVKLKKDGYTAYIKQSGIYYQVCLRYFDTKKNALKLLDTLKDKYKGCSFI